MRRSLTRETERLEGLGRITGSKPSFGKRYQNVGIFGPFIG